MKTAQRTAEDAYTEAHSEIVTLAHDISNQIFDLPAPSEDINWANVGDVNEIARQLRDVLARIRGEEN